MDNELHQRIESLEENLSANTDIRKRLVSGF